MAEQRGHQRLVLHGQRAACDDLSALYIVVKLPN
jgi:hypothetical protein